MEISEEQIDAQIIDEIYKEIAEDLNKPTNKITDRDLINHLITIYREHFYDVALIEQQIEQQDYEEAGERDYEEWKNNG